MADLAGNVNTACDDGVENQGEEPTVLDSEAFEELSDRAEQDAAGKPPSVAAENSWSAPIFSLARKASETISHGMSYAAAPRKLSHGSSASSSNEKEFENDTSGSSKILPGRLQLYEPIKTLSKKFTLK